MCGRRTERDHARSSSSGVAEGLAKKPHRGGKLTKIKELMSIGKSSRYTEILVVPVPRTERPARRSVLVAPPVVVGVVVDTVVE